VKACNPHPLLGVYCAEGTRGCDLTHGSQRTSEAKVERCEWRKTMVVQCRKAKHDDLENCNFRPGDPETSPQRVSVDAMPPPDLQAWAEGFLNEHFGPSRCSGAMYSSLESLLRNAYTSGRADRRERATPVAPGPTARMAVAFLLTRIGSWTTARWDQHLRHEIGDAAADEAIRWIDRTFGVTDFGDRPASKPWGDE
jgi:hypothetical protein